MRIFFALIICSSLQCRAFSFFKRSAKKVSYDGYQVCRITEVNESTLAFLSENDRLLLLRRKERGFPSYVDVMVRPSDFTECRPPACQVFIHDLGAVVRGQTSASKRRSGPESGNLKRLVTSEYLRYDSIVELLRQYQDSSELAKLEVIGKSYEQRPLVVLKISSGRKKTKPSIFIDGGIHAREWLSPASVLFLISSLQQNTTEQVHLLQDFDWYFMPVVNPDGYEYSHSTDRLWRKSRPKSRTGSCRGVDLNRNFDFKWGKSATSRSPCSDKFGGASPFSEPETKALAEYLSRIPNLVLYLATHSYGEYFLTPFGAEEERPNNYREMNAAALLATKAMSSVNGARFVTGSVADVMGTVSGGACDWVKKALNVSYSYSIELRGSGSLGFLAPTEQIVPSGLELLAAVKALVKYVKS